MNILLFSIVLILIGFIFMNTITFVINLMINMIDDDNNVNQYSKTRVFDAFDPGCFFD